MFWLPTQSDDYNWSGIAAALVADGVTVIVVEHAPYDTQFASDTKYWSRAKILHDAGLKLAVRMFSYSYFGTFPGYPDSYMTWATTGNDQSKHVKVSDPDIYTKIADYWVDFLDYAATNYSIDFEYISLQNEPDIEDYTGWTASQLTSGIKALRSALDTAGYTGVKIQGPDCMSVADAKTYLDTILVDSTAKAALHSLTFHTYGYGADPDGHISSLQAFVADSTISSSGKPYYSTEWTPQEATSLDSALKYMKAAYNDFLYGNVSARWAYIESLQYFVDPEASPLVRTVVGAASSQWSKYITPNCKRVSSTVLAGFGVYVMSFYDSSSGRVAIILLNMDSVLSQTFHVRLSNVGSISSFHAVRTSSTENAVDLSDIPVSDGRLTVTLPSKTITTLWI